MTIPEHFYRYMFSETPSQENIEFDTNGNELYHGVAPGSASNSDTNWVIAKGIYTQISVGTASVFVMTHVSYVKGVSWTNRAAAIYP